jgi:spore coat polysaccharide biosynthesis protein SpsF
VKTGFLITARLKSTRLPKKVLLPLHGREVIRWMIDRLKLCECLDAIVVCTSTNPQDDVLESVAGEEGVRCFRGSEEDVLRRLYDAAAAFGLDYAVNVTADTPLVSIEYIGETVEAYRRTGADLIRAMDLPHGFYCYGLKIAALEKVCQTKKSEHTEVWGRYFTDSGLFKVVDLPVEEAYRRDYRLTLDYPDDYAFFQRVFEHFGRDTCRASMAEIIAFLDANPDVVKINAHCEAMYQQRWDSQNKIEVQPSGRC